ncbi:MAG: DUF2238 domain-containing protein [Methylotetracoccus sp.]|nr:DUF2238 domain-containing protein [Methylotetracoccus sp.]
MRAWHGLLLLTGVWSAVQPADALTWWLEMAPALAAYGGLLATRSAFPLTPLTYWLMALLLVIISVGAHYGFAAVPWFDWLRTQTGGERNNFDRFAHFFQGFVPAALIREVLIRSRVAPSVVWLSALTLGLTLALSALYELVEWLAALFLGEHAESFLASQGDPWDAQTDMALALLGAAAMLGLCSRLQNRQIAVLQRSGSDPASARLH